MKTKLNGQLSASLSRALKQLVDEGHTIYAYHWDPPELDLYLGDEQPYHIRVNEVVMEHANDLDYLKEWIKGRMWEPTLK
ncbi:MAG: hypothetical protein JXB88_17775 [Spirochaetales bacterium]|nr:hypothetical protein [Spirochaetales bacterium]